MDDTEEKDELEDGAPLDDDLLSGDDDDLVAPKGKKGKIPRDDLLGEDTESLDALADEEEGVLPEDSFDDKDLW